ncbi:hypothetical protein J5N97_021179 [Dioscorea zingiberensis]|uniref:Uncharacterized protein n=1 Tax=Dioscorea zingiberensis TaxID=325984 RepID=A0A9D5CHR5_9LILI|nr:hypothetical protein J5N97_021179 [Dioscorea zingiberensis]
MYCLLVIANSYKSLGILGISVKLRKKIKKIQLFNQFSSFHCQNSKFKISSFTRRGKRSKDRSPGKDLSSLKLRLSIDHHRSRRRRRRGRAGRRGTYPVILRRQPLLAPSQEPRSSVLPAEHHRRPLLRPPESRVNEGDAEDGEGEADEREDDRRKRDQGQRRQRPRPPTLADGGRRVVVHAITFRYCVPSSTLFSPLLLLH